MAMLIKCVKSSHFHPEEEPLAAPAMFICVVPQWSGRLAACASRFHALLWEERAITDGQQATQE